MKKLEFTTHIENNAQLHLVALHLTLPSEYANQDVDVKKQWRGKTGWRLSIKAMAV